MSDIKTILNASKKSILNGGIILHPTSTVWGLACDATNETAVKKLSALKGRSQDKSYIVLLANDVQLESYVQDVPEVCWELIDCATTPLTIIYPKGKRLAKGVCAKDGSIAIRITQDKFIQQLIQTCKKPLISTSANLSLEATPKQFDEISDKIRSNVDYVVNLHALQMTGKPSSIIKVGINGEINIIRK